MTTTRSIVQLACGLGLGTLVLAGCSRQEDPAGVVAPVAQTRVVEAACGECQFGMEGDSCDLAVRIDGVGYFVDGTGLDDHGDAHAADGFCNAIRKATVVGEVVDGRFVVESFELADK